VSTTQAARPIDLPGDPGAIVFTTRTIHDGWIIRADFRDKVSAEDRVIVFDSLVQYQRTIAETHPSWTFNLTNSPKGVFLLIYRGDEKELFDELHGPYCDYKPRNAWPKYLVRQKKSWVDSGSGNLPSE
jgi:hypothetical protein